MRKNSIIVFLILLIIFIVSCKRNDIIHQEVNKQIKNDNQSKHNCRIVKQKMIIRGNSMLPIFNPNDSITILKGYYKCNDVKHGDIIIYDYKGNENPVIKKVHAIGGDKIEFNNNQLLINNSLVKNSTGIPLHFDQNEQKLISIYLEDSYLTKNGILIFSEISQSTIDSRKFGAINKSDIIGKVEIE